MDALTRVLELARMQGVLDVRCQVGGTFSMDHESLPFGEAPFHLVLAGEGQIELPGWHSLKLRAGDLVILPRGSSHRVREWHGNRQGTAFTVETTETLPVKRNGSDKVELDLLCGRFLFAPHVAQWLFASLPDALHVNLSSTHGVEVLASIVAIFRDEVARQPPGAMAVVTALTQTLFVFALRERLSDARVVPSFLSLMGDPRLARAIMAMMAEPQREWTVSSLAERASMSRATFARHFEARAHMSPHETLTLLRMHLAGEMLRRTGLTAGAVADRVGYRSESAFGKAFARVMGETPARYRRNVMGE